MSDWQGHDELIGKRIESIDLGTEGEAIRFNTSSGPLVYLAEGDCCSQSWIAHVEGVDRLIGATVTKVEDVTTNPADAEEDGEYGDSYQFYGLAIDTEKGRAVIDYRNRSNGYYGGSLELANGRGFQGPPPEEWAPLTADI